MREDKRPIRLIQVGMGGWGRDWATSVVPRATDFDRVACVDLDQAILTRLQAELDVPSGACFGSLEAALSGVDAEAVLITAALPGHVPVALAALRAGKHVLVEKPFAPSVAEAQEVVAVAEAAGRVLMVSQNYRHYPAVRAVASLIKQQVLGPVNAVSVQFRKYANAAPVEGHRHYTIRHPLLLDMSIHHFDLMRCVLHQEPTHVTCHAWNPPWSNFRDPAVASATIVFDGGAVVNYTGSWVSTAPDTTWAGAWSIECEGGEIAWASRDDFTLKGDAVVMRPRGKRARRVELPQIDHWDRAGTLHEFARAIRTGKEPETSGRENLGTLALTFGTIIAAETQQPQTIMAATQEIVGGAAR